MALNPFVTKEAFGKLPADVQKEYSPLPDNPDRYQLQVVEADGWKLAEVENLLKALSSERETSKSAAAKLKAFEGLDPRVARQALKTLEDIGKGEVNDANVAKVIQARETALRAEFEGKEATWSTERNKMNAALHETLVDAAALRAITAVDPKASTALLMPHVTKQLKVVEENGRYVTRVVDHAGVPRVADAAGTPVTPEQLIGEMRKLPAYAGAFSGTGSTGMGTSGASQGGGTGGKPGVLKINADDIAAVSANLEKLAKGEAELVYASGA